MCNNKNNKNILRKNILGVCIITILLLSMLLFSCSPDGNNSDNKKPTPNKNKTPASATATATNGELKVSLSGLETSKTYRLYVKRGSVVITNADITVDNSEIAVKASFADSKVGVVRVATATEAGKIEIAGEKVSAAGGAGKLKPTADNKDFTVGDDFGTDAIEFTIANLPDDAGARYSLALIGVETSSGTADANFATAAETETNVKVSKKGTDDALAIDATETEETEENEE